MSLLYNVVYLHLYNAITNNTTDHRYGAPKKNVENEPNNDERESVRRKDAKESEHTCKYSRSKVRNINKLKFDDKRAK